MSFSFILDSTHWLFVAKDCPICKIDKYGIYAWRRVCDFQLSLSRFCTISFAFFVNCKQQQPRGKRLIHLN